MSNGADDGAAQLVKPDEGVEEVAQYLPQRPAERQTFRATVSSTEATILTIRDGKQPTARTFT